MQIHLIAIGGAAMHNLAIALHRQGHWVSGSDDEIYNPAHNRLKKAGLLPEVSGWFPDRIHSGLDVVILGMHARADNPELARALALKLPVMSYPEFVFEHARNKQRLVVAGSHGKTTTTAMAMHAMQKQGMHFDYLVGAQLDGFDAMVSLTDAPVMVIEGDEYLSSALDPRPKMVHYRPHAAAITGIAWDHINVFPVFEDYLRAFGQFIQSMEPGAPLFRPAHDPHLDTILSVYCGERAPSQMVAFLPYPGAIRSGVTHIARPGMPEVALRVFGTHNLLNARAAALLCGEAGMSEDAFIEALESFSGAGKRLQALVSEIDRAAWLDFAHAPSKVAATTAAVKGQYPDRRLVAGVELHTFSSLNREFLPQYAGTLHAADQAFVFFSPETLSAKKMPPLDADYIRNCFSHSQLQVFATAEALDRWLSEQDWSNKNLLLMSSGRFGGWDAAQRTPEMLGVKDGKVK